MNENFFKLLKQENAFKNRQHFLAVFTRIMRRVLADYAMRRNRGMLGGPNQLMVSLAALDAEGEKPHLTTDHDLNAALDELEKHDARAAQIFKLREMWGMSSSEVAEMLGKSKSTVDRDCRFACAWLRSRLAASDA